MGDYIIRDIPADIWAKAKKRATKDGRTMRWVLLKLLACYADNGLPKEK